MANPLYADAACISLAAAACRRCGVVPVCAPFNVLGFSAIAAIALAAQFALVSDGPRQAGLVVASAAVLACAYSDACTGYVFDVVTVPAACAVFALSAWATSLPSVAGAVSAALALPVTLAFATRGRGIGGGDLKLAAVIGAALSPAAAFTAIDMGFIAGGIVAAVKLWAGTGEREMRFAPYLAIGFFSAALWQR